MEETITIANTGAPSTKTESTNAEEEPVASVSNNQEIDFKLMDSLYSATVGGDIKELEKNAKPLDQILTPNGNTILHIYIISLPPETAKPNKSDKKITNPKKKSEDGSDTHPPEAEFVTKVLEMCPNLLWKPNNKGETLLHFAARYGHGDIVKELIEECKKPHSEDQEHGVEPRTLLGKTNNEAKDTALHEAIRYNHIDVVNKLIEADPDLPYEANRYGETPLYLAAERGYIEIVKKILGTCKSSLDDCGPMNRTALHAAVIHEDKEMITELLGKKGNLINQEDEQGRLPLHYAAYLGYDDIVDVLLDKDPCTAYKADKEGKRALHLAAGNGKACAVDKLISKCPSCCELVDNKGRNALHLALSSENHETVDLVLKNPLLGNLVNQKDEKGNTPLLQLATSGSFIKSFIRHPRVDKLAFNCDNQNVADIILAKGLIVDSRKSFLDELGTIKKSLCRRIIVPKEEIIVPKEEISRERKVSRRFSMLRLRKEHVEAKDEYDEFIDKMMEAKESLLVAATLIVTVTFAAGFTLPGGFIQEEGPKGGAAMLIRSPAFQAFVIFDNIAFFYSCMAVFNHLTMALNTDKTQLYKNFEDELLCTFVAMIVMVFAFVTGIYAVLFPDKNLAITVCVIGCVLVYGYALVGHVRYMAMTEALRLLVILHLRRVGYTPTEALRWWLTPTEMWDSLKETMKKKKKWPQRNFYDE